MDWLTATLNSTASARANRGADLEPRQFEENGKVLLRKANPDDVGQCQINLSTGADPAGIPFHRAIRPVKTP
jgi:hypothetical protein